MKTFEIAPLKLDLFRAIDKMNEQEVKMLHEVIIKEDKNDFYFLLEDWQKLDIELGLEDLKKGKSMPVDDFLKTL